MSPKTPVLTEEFVPSEITYAKDQPEYMPLPVLRSQSGIVLSRWSLSDEEREAIASGADILLSVHTFNAPLQPVRIEVISCDRDLLEVAERMDLIDNA